MKKIIFGIITFASLTVTTSAQVKPAENGNADAARSERRAQHGDRINPRSLEMLDLTATQKEQIKLINEDYRSKMQDMIKSDLSTEERKAKRTGFEMEKKNKIMALLTSGQAKKLKEIMISEKTGDRAEYKEKIKVDEDKIKVKIKNG